MDSNPMILTGLCLSVAAGVIFITTLNLMWSSYRNGDKNDADERRARQLRRKKTYRRTLIPDNQRRQHMIGSIGRGRRWCGGG
jgi:hypothetical protein